MTKNRMARFIEKLRNKDESRQESRPTTKSFPQDGQSSKPCTTKAAELQTDAKATLDAPPAYDVIRTPTADTHIWQASSAGTTPSQIAEIPVFDLCEEAVEATETYNSATQGNGLSDAEVERRARIKKHITPPLIILMVVVACWILQYIVLPLAVEMWCFYGNKWFVGLLLLILAARTHHPALASYSLVECAELTVAIYVSVLSVAAVSAVIAEMAVQFIALFAVQGLIQFGLEIAIKENKKSMKSKQVGEALCAVTKSLVN